MVVTIVDPCVSKIKCNNTVLYMNYKETNKQNQILSFMYYKIHHKPLHSTYDSYNVKCHKRKNTHTLQPASSYSSSGLNSIYKMYQLLIWHKFINFQLFSLHEQFLMPFFPFIYLNNKKKKIQEEGRVLYITYNFIACLPYYYK